ncbi:MAG: DHHA1 domain-containing protein, partial [Oleibacter sp.]|nr:DHHA1 domain-containing protein [Thalassolituus sp.]
LVPNRFDFGYGLSPPLVDVAKTFQPDLILTVDNGIAAIDGVAAARAAGIDVVVTDHHLPGETLPDALAIVNPNQQGCDFSSKAACGCAVAFYLMLALRAKLEKLKWFRGAAPNLASLIDLVALATVADVVPLDRNNRILVEQGLRRIRAGHGQVGLQALLRVAGKDPSKVVSSDFGFIVGPRLNAAGRLDDMSAGIECLITDDPNTASMLAGQLDGLNRDRRQIEQVMQEEARALLDNAEQQAFPDHGISLFHQDWHQGVIGILASRIKEKYHRPVIAFAPSSLGDGGTEQGNQQGNDDQASADNITIKGSARSIPGLHIRDALDRIDRTHPGMIEKFGGHAMAAGLSIKQRDYEKFSTVFDQICQQLLTPEQLDAVIETDGELKDQEITLDVAQQLRWASPWGQEFPEPLFEGKFRLIQQKIVGQRHLKLMLQSLTSTTCYDAICFNVDVNVWPNFDRETVYCVYQLDVNEFRGQANVQLLIRHLD